jgi:hypothetical protein
VSRLRRIPAFCGRGDPRKDFFVQHAHVSPRFLVAILDFLAASSTKMVQTEPWWRAPQADGSWRCRFALYSVEGAGD